MTYFFLDSFQPFKNERAIFSSWAVLRQTTGWIWPVDCMWLLAPALDSPQARQLLRRGTGNTEEAEWLPARATGLSGPRRGPRLRIPTLQAPGLTELTDTPASTTLPLKSNHHLREGLWDGKKNNMVTTATPVTASEVNLQ